MHVASMPLQEKLVSIGIERAKKPDPQRTLLGTCDTRTQEELEEVMASFNGYCKRLKDLQAECLRPEDVDQFGTQ